MLWDEQAMLSSIIWLTKTSPVLLQHTGHACLQLANSLLLTSVDSEHTAWLVMHSSYTNIGGVKLLPMINTPSAIQLLKNLRCLLHSVSSQVGILSQLSVLVP